jgi:hypothetical protein
MYIYSTATQITPPVIYQTYAWDATISWLSLVRLDCYLHGQAYLKLQPKTLALLMIQQFMGGLAGGMIEFIKAELYNELANF